MKYNLLLISLLCVPLFTSCLDTVYVHYNHEPVVRAYFFSEKITCVVSESQGIISLQLNVDIYNDPLCKEYRRGDDVYNQLSLKHKDSYSGKLSESTPGVHGYCFAKDFTSIDIVCDKEYDALHPAGKSLADIVDCKVTSIYPWIKGGYAGTTAQTISKQLSSMQLDDMTMISLFPFVKLTFKSAPSVKGEYSFRITMKTDDGLIYEIDQDVAL